MPAEAVLRTIVIDQARHASIELAYGGVRLAWQKLNDPWKRLIALLSPVDDTTASEASKNSRRRQCSALGQPFEIPGYPKSWASHEQKR